MHLLSHKAASSSHPTRKKRFTLPALSLRNPAVPPAYFPHAPLRPPHHPVSRFPRLRFPHRERTTLSSPSQYLSRPHPRNHHHPLLRPANPHFQRHPLRLRH